jgi:glycosyltransferase involved in cell wall biosynthesis
MYVSRPVIHSVDAFNDPVKEAGAGISIAPENPQLIVDAIHTLAELSPSEREEMGERGREYVVRNHSYKALAEKLASLF